MAALVIMNNLKVYLLSFRSAHGFEKETYKSKSWPLRD